LSSTESAAGLKAGRQSAGEEGMAVQAAPMRWRHEAGLRGSRSSLPCAASGARAADQEDRKGGARDPSGGPRAGSGGVVR